MTEPSLEQRLSPKRGHVRIADLELLVRVPGRPDAIRAYNNAEQDEAQAYAAANGGTVEKLPPHQGA